MRENSWNYFAREGHTASESSVQNATRRIQSRGLFNDFSPPNLPPSRGCIAGPALSRRVLAGLRRRSARGASTHGLHLHAPWFAPALLLPREDWQGLRIDALPRRAQGFPQRLYNCFRTVACRNEPWVCPSGLGQLSDRHPRSGAARVSQRDFARPVCRGENRRANALRQHCLVGRRGRPFLDADRRAACRLRPRQRKCSPSSSSTANPTRSKRN